MRYTNGRVYFYYTYTLTVDRFTCILADGGGAWGTSYTMQKRGELSGGICPGGKYPDPISTD